MTTGSASVVINRDPQTVFAAVSDITRTGEFSPECVSGRWVGGATGPAVGAKFEGDNELKLAGMTLKKWTTTSEVTACVPGEVFEFIAEEYTTWRYQLEAVSGGTKLTESFDYAEASGVKKFVVDTVVRRPVSLVKGMQRTIDQMKAHLESQS